jgi:hypothetical protein
MNDAVKMSVSYAIDWLTAQNIRVPFVVLDSAVVHGIKTVAYFDRVIMAWVNDLYTHAVTEAEFVDRFAELLDQQLTRAWNEGMRQNGLTPDDMTEAWSATLQEIIASEYMYVDQFAADIAGGNFTLAQLQSRAGTWSNRYVDVMNRAVTETADGKDRLKWTLGATEEHCATCAALNGIVAWAKEWEALGVHPQQPPNNLLDCSGWRCDCSLSPTDQRRTRDAYGRIEAVLAGI